MSKTIEISRELLDLMINALDDEGWHSLADEAAAVLAAPVVERQPIAEVQHGPFDDVGAPQWVRVVTLGDFDLEHIPDGTKLYTSPPAPVAVVKPVVWRIPVNGDWFYGTKEQCEREYAEYTADFTAEDFDEDGPAKPEPLACLDKVKELNQ